VATPIMMLILQGAVLSNNPANVPWAVLDWSRTTVARRFVTEVQSTGYFLPPRPVASYEEGRQLLRRGDALALVVIPRDLARDVERRPPPAQAPLARHAPLPRA